MCDVCDSRQRAMREMTNEIIDLIHKYEPHLNYEEAVNLIMGIAVGIGLSKDMSKEELITIVAEIYEGGIEDESTSKVH